MRNPRILVRKGDALKSLRKLPDDYFHCVVTSPPCWGLRDYGGEKGMIGLEETFDEHLEALLGVFAEVKRVLRPDGTFWLNYGDAYVGGGRGGGAPGKYEAAGNPDRGGGRRAGFSELPAKNLMLLPARIAMALQEEGWFLRSEIVWHKPNPMPESVQDRPTCTHEKIFLLTKSPKYFYDEMAVRTPAKTPPASKKQRRAIKKDGRERKRAPTEKVSGIREKGRRYDDAGEFASEHGANLRNMWTVAPQPYDDKHYAVFPVSLIKPCIEAGTSEKGCCQECGAPQYRKDGLWLSGCGCGLDTVPCRVLDPFCGTGTTAVVAAKLGRDCYGIEINARYVAMAEKRIRAEVGSMFVDCKISKE